MGQFGGSHLPPLLFFYPSSELLVCNYVHTFSTHSETIRSTAELFSNLVRVSLDGKLSLTQALFVLLIPWPIAYIIMVINK